MHRSYIVVKQMPGSLQAVKDTPSYKSPTSVTAHMQYLFHSGLKLLFIFWISEFFPPLCQFFCCCCKSSGTSSHHILVRSEDGGVDDAQEQGDHVQHHWGPQQPVQVDHIPAAADPRELVVMGVVVCAGTGKRAAVTFTVLNVAILNCRQINLAGWAYL